MRLDEVITENLGPISSDTIVKKGVRKIYFVTTGRNAWNATWINQYNSGCMHTTFESAKKYGENLRKCGTVLYIREIPALIVEGVQQSLVITQINTDYVLLGYTPTPVDPRNKRINHLRPGTSMASFYGTVASIYGFWNRIPDISSVIILTTQKKLKDFEMYSFDMRYVSSSTGSGNHLIWSPILSGVVSIDRSLYLRRIVKKR